RAAGAAGAGTRGGWPRARCASGGSLPEVDHHEARRPAVAMPRASGARLEPVGADAGPRAAPGGAPQRRPGPTGRNLRVRRPAQLPRRLRDQPPLVAGALELVVARAALALPARDRARAVGRAAGDLVERHLSRERV